MLRVESFQDTYYVPIDLTVLEREVFERVKAEVAGDQNYRGVTAARFDRLLLLIVKFVRVRIDDMRTTRAYLAAFSSRSSAPKEAALQLDLHDYLTASGSVDIEKSSVASGRADLYIPDVGFRFVTEVKRLFDDWDSELEPFIAQTAAYQQTDVRLGFLAVLDLTTREPGTPHFSDCIFTRIRTFPSSDERRVVVVRVPANKATPSEQ